MDSASPGLWPYLRRPITIIILGLLPFWLFFGISQTMTVNGEVTQDSSLNVLGIILAIIGIVMAFKVLRDDGSVGQPPRWWPRTVLTILAGLLCVFQLVQSVGFYKIDVAAEIGELLG